MYQSITMIPTDEKFSVEIHGPDDIRLRFGQLSLLLAAKHYKQLREVVETVVLPEAAQIQAEPADAA